MGQHISFDDSRYRLHHLGSAPIDCLLYRDPDPGEPIVCFGASSHATARADVVFPTMGGSVEYPVNRNSIYYSHTSLENVYSVQCFYSSYIDNHDESTLCVGILLEYSNRRRVALGQCRIGASKSRLVIAPVAIYMKTVGYGRGLSRVLIEFTTSSCRSDEPYGVGWKRKEMVGEITWWFDYGVVEIILP